jgi:hypothetical protein
MIFLKKDSSQKVGPEIGLQVAAKENFNRQRRAADERHRIRYGSKRSAWIKPSHRGEAEVSGTRAIWCHRPKADSEGRINTAFMKSQIR